MARLIDADALLAAYDAAHKGPPGGARKLIVEAPTVDSVPVMHWISVEESQPKTRQRVLIAIKSSYNGCYYITTGAHCNDHEITTDDYGWQDYDGDTEYDEDKDCFFVKGGWWETNYVEDNQNWEIDPVDGVVTHWMPLPKPPKEEDDAEQ